MRRLLGTLPTPQAALCEFACIHVSTAAHEPVRIPGKSATARTAREQAAARRVALACARASVAVGS